LKELDLSHNLIEELHAGTFTELISLETLTMNFNRIEVLPDHLFRYNENLQELFLWYNRIEVIEPALLNHLPKLTFLDLADNVCVSMFKNGTSADIALLFQNTTAYCKEENRMETLLTEYEKEQKKIQDIYNDFAQEEYRRNGMLCPFSAGGIVEGIHGGGSTETIDFICARKTIVHADVFVGYLKGNLTECYYKTDNLTDLNNNLNVQLEKVKSSVNECKLNISHLKFHLKMRRS
jgi:Leucine-rich repeat (LRR) protein